MERLYWITPGGLPSGRGLFWPPAVPDPARTELVAWEAEADAWNGDELVDCGAPWLLASAGLVKSIRAAELTGLRVGAVADLTWSESTAVLARLGELAAKELPEFRIVVPEHAVEFGPAHHEPDQGIGVGDKLLYAGWNGDDFSYPATWPGFLASERALSVLRTHRVDQCQIQPVDPR